MRCRNCIASNTKVKCVIPENSNEKMYRNNEGCRLAKRLIKQYLQTFKKNDPEGYESIHFLRDDWK